MLDPVLKSALVVIVVSLLKAYSPIPLDDVTLNILAGGIVTYILLAFGYESLLAIQTSALRERGLLPKE